MAESADSRPRIADIIPRLQLRGAEVFAQHLEIALRDRYDPALFPIDPSPGPRATLPDPPLDIRTSEEPVTTGRLRQVTGLRSRVKRFDPALIVAHGGDPLRVIVGARLHKTAPVVYVRVASVPEHLRTAGRMKTLRTAYRQVAAFVAVSESLSDELVDVFEIDPARVRVIGNGRLRGEPMRPDERGRIRAELGIAGVTPMVIWVGRFVEEKDPPVAAAVAERFGPQAKVVMVGDGPMLGDVAGAHAPVILTGARSDVTRLIAASDVLLSTSTTEGAPGVFVEALLAGVPIVTPDVGGVRDLVEDGVNGRLVPEADAQRLADAVAGILGDPAMRARLAEGAARSGDRFEITPVADAYDEVYRRVLAGDRRDA